jgi:hypothetical protein
LGTVTKAIKPHNSQVTNVFVKMSFVQDWPIDFLELELEPGRMLRWALDAFTRRERARTKRNKANYTRILITIKMSSRIDQIKSHLSPSSSFAAYPQELLQHLNWIKQKIQLKQGTDRFIT